jgi:hypothetical protein
MNGALLPEVLGETATSVLVAVLPLAALFIALQIALLRLPGRDFRNIRTGTLLSAAGLFLFLLGVGIGLLPPDAPLARRAARLRTNGSCCRRACFSAS